MSEWEPPAPVDAPASVPGQLFISGQWYPQQAAIVTTLSPVENDAYAYPFVVNNDHTFSAIGNDVTSGGGTGSVLRFSIYKDNGSGYPGALVTDFGTVASTGTGAAVVTPAGGITLAPGLYWLILVAQGGTSPIVTADNGFWSPVFGTSAVGFVAGTNRTGYRYVGGIAGVMPNPFPSGAGVVATTAVTQLEA